MPVELSRPKPISTILAIRVAEEDAEIDRLSAIFKVHGKIQQMRIVPPEKKLPNYLLVSTIKNLFNFSIIDPLINTLVLKLKVKVGPIVKALDFG